METLIAIIIILAFLVGAFYIMNKAPWQDEFANAEDPSQPEPEEEVK